MAVGTELQGAPSGHRMSNYLSVKDLRIIRVVTPDHVKGYDIEIIVTGRSVVITPYVLGIYDL